MGLPDLTWLFFDLSSTQVVAILLTVVHVVLNTLAKSIEAGFHELQPREKSYARRLLLRIHAICQVLTGPTIYGAHCCSVWLGMALGEEMPAVDVLALLSLSHFAVGRAAYQLGGFNAMTPPDAVTIWIIHAISVVLASSYMTLQAIQIAVEHDLAKKRLFLGL